MCVTCKCFIGQHLVGNELCFPSFCELRYDVRNRILNLLQVPVLGLFFNRLIMNKYGERERESPDDIGIAKSLDLGHYIHKAKSFFHS